MKKMTMIAAMMMVLAGCSEADTGAEPNAVADVLERHQDVCFMSSRARGDAAESASCVQYEARSWDCPDGVRIKWDCWQDTSTAASTPPKGFTPYCCFFIE